MVLIVLGIVVNGAICFVMLHGKRYMKNTSNFFIFHLSVIELLFRLLVSPIVINFIIPRSEIKSIQCKALTFLSTTFISAAFINLAAITTDRYHNIICSMKALKWNKNSRHLVFLVWLYATVVSIPAVVSVKSISIYEISKAQGMDCENCSDKKICDMPQNKVSQVSTTIYFVFAFLVPLIVIFVLYMKIAIVLHQRSKNRMMHKVAARSLGYTLSLGPTTLFAMLRSRGFLNSSSFGDRLTVTWVTEFLTLISSLGNPIIYAYYNGNFRKELSKPFCRSRVHKTR